MVSNWAVFLATFISFFLLLQLLKKKYRLVPVCTIPHRLGPILLSHHAKVPCEVALWVAQRGREIWERGLRSEFPEETKEDVILTVVHIPYGKMGWADVEESRAVINLSCFFLDITHPSFEVQERLLRGVVAEELHHVAYFRRYGDEEYVFRVEEDSDQRQLEKILYYALNPQEYAALRFCVQETGDRAELLQMVEAYRRRGTEFP